MPLANNYYREWDCKHCGVRQLVYFGDPVDFTVPDVEAVRCFICKGLELVGEEFDFCCTHSLFDENDKPIKVTDQILEEYTFIEEGKSK